MEGNAGETVIMFRTNGAGANVGGINLEMNYVPFNSLIIESGFTWQQSNYNGKEVLWEPESGAKDSIVSTKNMLRSPDTYGFFNVRYSPEHKWTFSLNGTYTGSMITPHLVNPENEYNALTTVYSVFEKIDQTNLYALALGLVTILIIVILNNLKIKIPSYLVAIIIGIASVKFFNLENQLEIIGEFSATFPRPHMIKFNLITMQKLLSSVFAIAILSFIQILSIIKVMEEKTDDSIDVNREFVNLGIINMTVSFFRGFVVTGSFSKSFANYESGAYSRLSGFFSGVSALIIILTFSSIIEVLPIATLAAIILVVAYKLIDFSEISMCFKTTRFDGAVFLATFLMTIISPRLDYAVYFGVIVSIIFVLKRSSNIKSDYLTYNSKDDSFVKKHSGELKKEDYIVINLSGIMHFNVSDNLKEEFDKSEIEKDKYVIRMRDVEYIDITVIKELEIFINKVKGREGEVYLSGVDDRNYKKLKNYGIIKQIEEDHIFRLGEEIFSSTKEAIDEIDKHE